MPSTTELVNIMELSAPGWNRDGSRGLIEVLNQAQDLLMLQEMAQTQAYRSDGKLPYIATVDGTYSYTLNQATTGLSNDIWRVAAVLLRPEFSSAITNIYQSDYNYEASYAKPVQPYYYNGVEYFRFYQASVVDALRGGYPTLRMHVNPGDTTTDFYLLAYKKPTKISDESIASSVPENLHLNYLLPTAMKLIEAYTTNNWIEAMKIIDEYLRGFKAEMGEGEQGDQHTITRIEE